MESERDNYAQQRRRIMRKLSDIAIEKGITHEMIAEKTGFMRNNISRMLAGKYPPSLDNFLMLCDAIDINLSELDKS